MSEALAGTEAVAAGTSGVGAPAAGTGTGATAGGTGQRDRWRSRGLGLVLPALLLAAWAAAARTGLLPASLLPGPGVVLRTLAGMAADGSLGRDLRATGFRLGAGFGLGASAGIGLGGLVGAVPAARRMLDPTVQGLRSVPSIAWVPLFILWFGIFDTSRVLLIAVGVFFPVYLNLSAAVAGVDRRLLEVGRVHGMGPFERLRRIALPASLPGLLVGLRGGLGLGWMFVAAAELMGASEGLGFELEDGDQTGRPERIIAALIVFALCGKATDLLLVVAGRPLVSWQDTEGERR
ncbi:MAG: ABC transporter permease [Gluconacetobacter diazotrophicus]|nr:ABC transporter permease [Gluconacetobacter diazotrophicus]